MNSILEELKSESFKHQKLHRNLVCLVSYRISGDVQRTVEKPYACRKLTLPHELTQPRRETPPPLFSSQELTSRLGPCATRLSFMQLLVDNASC
jgi:hypothetical protein